ncbi:alkaline phosphatase [Mongoliitalea daihaiensis]|uniref:alkaline phosphatase n=1 Tax=Mongoliitalea daihaiensis TaxID=2782006 RepID=UPI001F43069A|nr:alkaline phosphatase [Mongoliitalea daihaiensis]UJP63555.1 alkaline phosphatase [Mongoliitalea daihaiensis]
MKRREFFRKGVLSTIGLGALGTSFHALGSIKNDPKRLAKNIIFLVSDGMSTGTLAMTDILLQNKEGRSSEWIKLYEENKVRRALMETASANSYITDSAAAGSAWGGGMRVKNGALNVGPNGEKPVPILQKFKSEGKSVGCVTSVQITHATPASFCVNNSSRNAMPVIAENYLELKFDCMLGGGLNYFDAQKRNDKKDLISAYKEAGFDFVKSKEELFALNGSKPIMGVFAEEGLPYAIDRENNSAVKASTPSLSEMTETALQHLSKNPQGFVLQVEGGKVDWAAHANDTAALLYDQVDFDEAVKVAMEFAQKNEETLVIITTDHGNSNPGLFYGNQANRNFEKLFATKASNEWILNQITPEFSTRQLIDFVQSHQNYVISEEDATTIIQGFTLGEDGLYNTNRLPVASYAKIQSTYTSVQWAGTNHSADHVELAMFGPGSELLKGFVRNFELHNFMLHVAGMPQRWMV